MPAILVFSKGFSEVILGLLSHPNMLQDEKYRELLEVKPTNPKFFQENTETEVNTPVFGARYVFWGSRKMPTKNQCVQESSGRQNKNVV